MTKLRIFIADDERPAREYLKAILRGFEIAEIVGEADNGGSAVESIRELKPDLALLDLQMPQLTGLEVVRELKPAEMPLVAFVTAFDDHAIQAFELNAVDYLLKPVEAGRLRTTLDRAAERLDHIDWREQAASRIDSTIDTYEADLRSEPLTRIPVRERELIRLVPTDEITSIVADGELLHIYTGAGRRHVINFRLKDIETRLDNKKFVRASRGSIVNLTHVESFSPMPGGTYLIKLTDGREIATSRLQSKLLRDRLFKL